MASRTSTADPTPFDTFARDIARRRAVADAPDLPRAGERRRTPGKRALLRAIGEAGGDW